MSASPFGGFQGIGFDVYGTLFDVRSIERACARITDDPVTFSSLWRSKQLEYATLRTVMDRYVDFGQITSDALDFAIAANALEVDPFQRGRLMRAWKELEPFPEVPLALDHLHAAGQRLVVLSNGTREMLEPLLTHSGLLGYFIDLMTCERVQVFKPDPHVYAMLSDRFHARTNEILFVTANGFDIAGAKAAGLSVCRIDRAGTPLDPLGYAPDMTVGSLDEMTNLLLGDPGMGED